MAGEVITVDQLRQLLGVQADLRQQAERRWQAAQRALVALLEAYAPEEVDRRLKSGQPLDSLGVEELGLLLRQSLSAIPKPIAADPALKEQLQASQAELAAQRTANQSLVEKAQSLSAERDSLQAQLTALQQSAPVIIQHVPYSQPSDSDSVATAPQPEWMVDWRKAETFERDAKVLRLLGESGLSRRPLVEQQAAERLGIRKAGGSLRALISRLENLGLVEVFHPWDTSGAKTGGRMPDLLRLTERGGLAYWLLSGCDPVQNEYDALLPYHVSPEHTLLNLQAADTLRDTGLPGRPYPARDPPAGWRPVPTRPGGAGCGQGKLCSWKSRPMSTRTATAPGQMAQCPPGRRRAAARLLRQPFLHAQRAGRD